jgi:hypothetical protein
VTVELQGPNYGDIAAKSISFYDSASSTVTVISIEPVALPTISQPVISTSLYPSILISENAIAKTIDQNQGFKAVLGAIQALGAKYTDATALTSEIQTINHNITKYSVVLDVKGIKEQVVYIYDNTANTS